MEIVRCLCSRLWLLSLRGTDWRGTVCCYVLVFLAFIGMPGCRSGAILPTGPEILRYTGFSVLGPYWPVKEVFADEAERLAYLEQQGYLVARHTSQLYGNMVRVPISVWRVLGHGLPRLPLDDKNVRRPLYQVESAVVQATIAQISTFLQASLTRMAQDQNASGQPLRWQRFDAFLSGIHKYNIELAASLSSPYSAVSVTLLLTAFPPAPILEAPHEKLRGEDSTATVRGAAWGQYQELYIRFVRKLVQRYGRGYMQDGVPAVWPVAVAIELFNEPDYVWLPDELKIEKALNPDAYPCDKYITQLHLSQVPENDLPGKGCIQNGGYYREQPLPVPALETPLKEFRWGSKFDLYINFLQTYTNMFRLPREMKSSAEERKCWLCPLP